MVYIQFDNRSAVGGEFGMFLAAVRRFRWGIEKIVGRPGLVNFDRHVNKWFFDTDAIIREINDLTAVGIWSVATTFREDLDRLVRATRQLIQNYDEVVSKIVRIQEKALSVILGAKGAIIAEVEPETASPVVPAEYRDLYTSIVIRVSATESEMLQRFIDALRRRLISRFTLSYRFYDVRVGGYSRYSYSFAMVSYDQGVIRIDVLRGLVKEVIDVLIMGGIYVKRKPLPQIKLGNLVVGDRVDPDKVYAEVKDYINELMRRIAAREGEAPLRTVELRPYQVDAVAETLTWLYTSGRALIEVPTGGGKTMIATLIAHIMGKYNEDLSLLMTTFRSDIVRQFGDYLVERLAPLRDSFTIDYVHGGEIETRCYRNGIESECPTASRRVKPDAVVATSASLYYAIVFAYYMIDEVKRRAREVYPDLRNLAEQRQLDEIVRIASEKCGNARIVDRVREAASRGAVPTELLRRLSSCVAYHDFIKELYRRERSPGGIERWVIKEEQPVSIREINRRIKPKLMDMLVRVLYAPVALNIDELIKRVSKDYVEQVSSFISSLIAKAKRGSARAERELRTIVGTALRFMLTELYMRISSQVRISEETLRTVAEDLARIYENYLPDRQVQVGPDRASIARAVMGLIRQIRLLADKVTHEIISHGLPHTYARLSLRLTGRKLNEYSLAMAVLIRTQISRWLGDIVTPYRARAVDEEQPRGGAEQVEVAAEEGQTVVVEPDDVIEIDDLPEIKGKEELVFTRTNIALAFKLFRLRRRNVLIIIDEAHHTPASSIALLLLFFKRALVLGLTATPYRGDKLDTLIYGLAGSIVYSISSSALIGRGYLVPAYIFNLVYHTRNNAPLQNVASDLTNALKSLKNRLMSARDMIPQYKRGQEVSSREVKERLIAIANDVASALRSFFDVFSLAPVFDRVRELASDETVLEEVLRLANVDKALRHIRNKYGVLKDVTLPDLLMRECSKPEFRDHMQCICTSSPNIHRADLHSTTSELPWVTGYVVAQLIRHEYCNKYGVVQLITPEFLARMAVRLLMLYAVATLDVRPGVGEWTPRARIASFSRRIGNMIRSVDQAISSIYVRAINNDIVRNWMLADAVMQAVHGMTKASGAADFKYGDSYTTFPFAIVTPWREGADRMYALMVTRVAAHCYTYPRLYGVDPMDSNLLDTCLARAKALVKYVHGGVPTDVPRETRGAQGRHKEVETRKKIYNALRERRILGIVATTVLNEGIDIPSLTILAIHRGGRGRVGTKQVVGRGLRPYSDGRFTKRALILIDVIDMDNPSSIAANRCRMTFYCVDEPLWVKVQISDEYLYDFKHASHNNTGYYTIPSPKFYYMPQPGVGSFFELVGYYAVRHELPIIEVAPNTAMYMPAYLERARREYGYTLTRYVSGYLRGPIFGRKGQPGLLSCLDINQCIAAFMRSYDAVKDALSESGHWIGKTGEMVVRECMGSLGNINVMVVRGEGEDAELDYDKFRNVVSYDYSARRYVVAVDEQRINLARRLSSCLAFNWAYSISNCRVFAENGPARDPLTAYLCLMRELYVVDADSLDVYSAIYVAKNRYEHCRKPGADCEKPPKLETLSLIRAQSPVCVMNLLYRIRSIMRGPYKDEFEHLLDLYGRMYGIRVESPGTPEEEEGDDYLADVLVRYLAEYAYAYIYALKELC